MLLGHRSLITVRRSIPQPILFASLKFFNFFIFQFKTFQFKQTNANEFGLGFLTFTSSQIEIKINNVGALLVTSWRAKLGSELWLKKSIWWNPNRVPINPTCFNTLISLYVFSHPLNHHFWCPALVLHASITRHRCLQQTPFPRRRYRKCANILWQILTYKLSYTETHAQINTQNYIKFNYC